LIRARSLFVLAAATGVWAAFAPACARADEAKAIIRGVEDEDLRDRMERAVGETDKPPESRFQARRRANDAAEDIVAVLRSEGYYAYEVTPEVTDTDPPKAVVRVVPGPRFRFSTVGLEWLRAPTDARTAELAEKAIDLKPRQPGRAADVLAAEGRIVATLSSRGYADAKAGERRVTVDHADQSVQPLFRIDAGPLVRLDGVQLETTGRTNPRWVSRLAPWKPGEVYDPEDVAELERRLLDTGVYDSVAVALTPADKTTTAGTRPVLVSLVDRPKGTIELGAGFSTSEGFGFDALYNRYNRFGRADTLTLTLRLAEIQQRAGLSLSLPHWGKPARTLVLSTEAFQELTEAYDRAGANVKADIRQRIGKTSFYNYGVWLEAARIQDLARDPVTGVRPLQRDLGILTFIGGGQLDRSNDPLDPTQGWRLIGDVQPTVVGGSTSLTFVRVQAQGTAYLPLDRQARTVIAGRLRLGSIFNGSIPDVPADRRFYAGGGGSVRGYEYQGIGPRLPNGAPQGGLSLAEMSIEARRRLFGNWGAAVFLDGGAVSANATPDFSNARLAAGFGVRYHLPFAPIRADFAFPLDRSNGQPTFQLYVSIGQAF
jgi:translocation and assembly module TamA